jgi:hypothetical protein
MTRFHQKQNGILHPGFEIGSLHTCSLFWARFEAFLETAYALVLKRNGGRFFCAFAVNFYAIRRYQCVIYLKYLNLFPKPGNKDF